MNIQTKNFAHCPICHSKDSEFISQSFDYELETCTNTWVFVKCTHCSLIRLERMPEQTQLPVIYPPHYYSYDFENNINSIALKAKALIDRKKIMDISKYLPQICSYLDIGCGSGRMLRSIKSLKNIDLDQIHGIDFDNNSIQQLKSEGFNTECCTIEEATILKNNSIDLITLFHVIEHVDDPRALMDIIYKKLSPKGVVAIETPNYESIDFKLFKNNFWGGYHTPRHFTIFNKTSLESLLQSSGLQIINIQYKTGHAFWMWSIHHTLKYNKKFPMPKLANYFNPLRSLFMISAFTVFDMVRAKLGFKTSSILIIARKDNV